MNTTWASPIKWAIWHSVMARRLYLKGDEKGSWEALVLSRFLRSETT